MTALRKPQPAGENISRPGAQIPPDATAATVQHFATRAEHQRQAARGLHNAPGRLIDEAWHRVAIRAQGGTYVQQCAAWSAAADLMAAFAALTDIERKELLKAAAWEADAIRLRSVTGFAPTDGDGVTVSARAVLEQHPALAAYLAEIDADKAAAEDSERRRTEGYAAAQTEAARLLAEGRKLAPAIVAKLAQQGITLALDGGGRLTARPGSLVTPEDQAALTTYAAALRELLGVVLVVG